MPVNSTHNVQSQSSNMSDSRDHEDASARDIEVIEVDGLCLNVIKPAAIFTTNGTIFELPEETIRAVDDFEVPKGFQRSGCREQSFMYSLGVYVKPVDPNDRGHKYYCMVSSTCRTKKTVIPCKNGDRSNVNSHHKKHCNFVVLKARKKRKANNREWATSTAASRRTN